jgi:hypothetical protein
VAGLRPRRRQPRLTIRSPPPPSRRRRFTGSTPPPPSAPGPSIRSARSRTSSGPPPTVGRRGSSAPSGSRARGRPPPTRRGATATASARRSSTSPRDRLYFASDRPRTGRDPQPDLDLWFVDRDGDGWTEPRRLTGGVNDRRELGFASIARDGALVAAVADERGPSLVEAQPTADGYGAPAPIVLPDPPAGSLGAPLLAPDRSFLLFTVEPGPFGGADLMVAFRTVDGGWGPSAPLLGVNTEADETAPALSPDERRLIFASDRPGGAGATDLYQVALAVALPAR